MEEYSGIHRVVEGIKDYLRSQQINVTIDDTVHETLRRYVEQQEMSAYTRGDIAGAIAVITWCSVAKVTYESLQWAQVRELRMNPFRVYPSDIRAAIDFVHKPDFPDDPCTKAVEAIRRSEIANTILPDNVKRMIAEY